MMKSMMKTRRFISMMMAAAMTVSSMCVMNAFAEAEADANAATDGIREDEEYGYTTTDIDVSVGAKLHGSNNPDLVGVDCTDLEGQVKDNTVDEVGSTPTIYVEVEWDELTFEFDYGKVKEYVWDIDALKYVPGEIVGRGWNKTTADITFTSHSNRQVYCGCYFEKNPDTDIYDDVQVTFTDELDLPSVVELDALQVGVITMTVSGEPKEGADMTNVPQLGSLKFYLSETARFNKPIVTVAEEEETDGEHVCHFVYDQFGRLVCTGCNKVKHEYCIDMDEDGLCDECGMERDFCEDCHVGGTCKCI